MKEKRRTQIEVAQKAAQHYIAETDKWFIYKEFFVEEDIIWDTFVTINDENSDNETVYYGIVLMDATTYNVVVHSFQVAILKFRFIEGQVYSVRFDYMPIEEYLNIKRGTTK